MKYVGITERGDAGIDLSWTNKLDRVAFAIVITKNVTNDFIQECIKYKNKLIVHATVTGYGSTILEPNVPDKSTSYEQVLKLIEAGFPVKQLVLRLDPIIPTDKGIDTAESVLKLFKDTGITRCRYSYLDMYKHVMERFINNGIRLPYTTFTASKIDKVCAETMLQDYSDTYEFESCAEFGTSNALGCISYKDCQILNTPIELGENLGQRKACLCPRNKLELLNNRHPCKHKCLYCYWKD